MFFNKKKEDELNNNFEDKNKTEKIVQELLKRESNINRKIITNFFTKVDKAIKK